jgi:hypothetical protein
MQYLWFIAQKLKDRLQRAIQGNTSKEQIDTFVKDLSMENLPALFSALREKFPKDRKGKVTKWRDRKPNSKTRSILAAFGKCTDLISGEDPASLVTAYLSQPKRANILKEVNTTTLDSVVIQRLAPLLQQCDPNNDEQSYFRRNVTKCLVDIQTRKELQEQGFNVGKDLWKKARAHWTKQPTVLWGRGQRGRNSIGDELKQAIRTTVLSDEHSKLTYGGSDKTRSLTSSKAAMFRSLAKDTTIRKSTFHKYTFGGKCTSSVVPELRKAKGKTDMCVVCQDSKNQTAKLLQRIAACQAQLAESDQELMKKLLNYIQESRLTLDMELTRSQQVKSALDQLDTCSTCQTPRECGYPGKTCVSKECHKRRL